MGAILWILALFGSLTCSLTAGNDVAPEFKRSILLPDVTGRIDHMAYDAQTERLFVAAVDNGSLEVVDLKTGERVKSVKGLKEPQGVVVVPVTAQVVVACGGDGSVHAYDALTLEEKKSIKLGDDADNIRLDGEGKTILVGYGDGAVAELDAATLARAGEIKLDGHPESFQPEPGSARVFINVPGGLLGGGGEVAVADRLTRTVRATWKLKDAGRNFPMALDAAGKRLYVGCRRPARLLVMDTESGKVLASVECVGDADDVFVDPKTGRVLVIGGGGAIDVFETKDAHTWARIATVKTGTGARTGILVPDRRAIFVAVPKESGHPAEIREYGLAD